MTKDEALKKALEALETLHDENMDYLTRNKLGGENNQCMVFAREAITAIKEALMSGTDGAQPEQEPVTGVFDYKEHAEGLQRDYDLLLAEYNDLKAQRTWVGLTDEEVDQFEIWYDEEEERKGWVEPRLVAQYFEAKLKEKNT